MDTIAVTGGNGTIGRAILEHLGEAGYETVNLARGSRREDVSHEYRTTDLLDAGEVYGSLAASGADAIIHMGTIPTPTSHPGYVTYESNVMSSYHVLEAATALELEAACLASSINAMGAAFQDAPTDVRYLPVDEDHPVTPRDPYAIGKHVIEVTADGFGRLPEAPRISTLRYPWVASGSDLRDRYAERDRTLDEVGVGGRSNLFTYLHLADAASVARRAVEAEFSGHERFWAVAADTTVDAPTSELIEAFYPEAEVRRTFEGTESIVSIEKAKTLLAWEPTRTWRDL